MSTNLSCVKKAATMQNLSCLRIQKDPARGKEKKQINKSGFRKLELEQAYRSDY